MTIEKRRRGRPLGEGRKYAPYLAQVADLIVKDPSLKPTTAMKRIMHDRTDWGASDETLLRRWQVKWKGEYEFYLTAARNRAESQRRANAAIGSTPNFHDWLTGVKPPRGLWKLPHFDAMRGTQALSKLNKFEALANVTPLLSKLNKFEALANVTSLLSKLNNFEAMLIAAQGLPPGQRDS
jgi:hypothetical protein